MGTWAWGRAALLAAWAVLGFGCSSDIFDVEVDLETKVYTLDLGARSGTIPDVTCDANTASVCDLPQVVSVDTSAAGLPATVELSVGCDPATSRCYAEGQARTTATVDVLSDADFTSKVARRSISLVRLAAIDYTVPANSLTIDVPQIDVYVGPEGTTRESDPKVVLVGSTPPVPAGTTFGDAREIAVGDDSPARDVIEGSIRARRPFVFVVVLAPRVTAGAPVPAGQLQVAVSPRLLVGFPR
jgi:hypothetical protein